MLNNISIKTKLIVLSVLPMIGLVLIIFLALQALKETEHGSSSIYNDRVVPLEGLKVIADDYAILVIDAVNKANAGIFTLEKTIADIEQSKLQIADKWDAYMATYLTAEEEVLASEAQSLFLPANAAIENLLRELRQMQGSPKGKLEAFDGPLYTTIDPISDKITELVNLQLRVAKQEYVHIGEIYNDNVFYPFSAIKSTDLIVDWHINLYIQIYDSSITAYATDN